MGWTLQSARATGRLPKYNPQRRKTFSIDDWHYLCAKTEQALRQQGLRVHAGWVTSAAGANPPRRSDQDKLDACLCLLTAVHLAEGRESLMVGDLESGYMAVPFGQALHDELQMRCEATGRVASRWVRRFKMTR